MNNVLTALCGIINFMPPWIMLGVFGAIILLIVFIIALKGVKRKFFRVLIYILVGLMPFAYLVYLGVQVGMVIAANDAAAILQLITFAISWGPTVIFALIVLIAILRGMRRGLRKSLILSLHAACAGAVCVAFFFIMIYVKEVDESTVKFYNWLAGENALQHALGVPESCSTLRQILTAYIPTFFEGDSVIGIIIQDNAAYLYTLVDMAYRIVFGILSWILFFAIDFILYIVYILCYSQRKYRKNKKLAFVNGKTDRDYKKHRIGGGVVGLVRGIATGLLCISFLGSAFFIAAGGKGEGKLDEDYDFGNDDINFYYQIYRSVEGYGAQGIFKILNVMSDAADTPYYLFAADLVFSGELNDEEFGISENVKFREELAAFTGFARDTLALIMKYGPEELNSYINGEVTDDAMDTVISVITKPGFKEEFESLIDAFDSQTYVINLSLSLVKTIANHIDDISFTKDAIGEGERELIKLIFKKGFLSENIPDECALMDLTGKQEAEGSNIRPYITVNHILTRQDVKTVLNIAFSVLTYEGEETQDELELVKSIVDEVSRLSILGSSKKAEFNPVLTRMYCLFENLYLTGEDEEGVTCSEIAGDGIDWIDEIHQLFAVVDDAAVIYVNLIEGKEDLKALDIVKALFNEESELYADNMAAYDHICSLLIDSRVLGRAFTTNFIYRKLSEGLKSVHENTYTPQNIVYGNTYGKDGNLVYGETYLLLYGAKLLFTGENAGLLDTLMNTDAEAEINKTLDILAKAVETTDGKGTTLATYLTDSVILRSVISIELIEVGGNTFYVPQAAREKVDGEYVPLIIKEELKGLLDNMSALVDFVMPFVDKEDVDAWQPKFDELVTKDDFYNLVRANKIFEGTVAQMFIVKLDENETDTIVVPAALAGVENIDGWITVNGKRGELLNLLDALRKTQFSISGIIVGDGDNEDNGDNKFESATVLEKITGMTEEEREIFFSSRVLHYTVSGYMLDPEAGAKVGDDFVLIVPLNSRQALKNDSLDYIVKKSELISLFGEIQKLDLYNDSSAEKILSKIAKDMSLLEGSKIIPASIVATVVGNENIAKDLIPELYDKDHMGSTRELEHYDSTNPWTVELPALIRALDELLGLSADEDFSLDDINFDDEVSNILLKLNDDADIDVNAGVETPRTKLRILYDSVIFRTKMTVEVDKVLTDDIVDGFVLSYSKLNGYYKFDELQALSTSANALGIESFNKDEFTTDSVKGNLTVDNLSTVYASTIVKGIITKSIQNVIADGKSDVCDHPMAYQSNLRVYKESEIESLLVVCGDLDGGDIVLDKVSEYLYKDGVTKSYLLVASISAKVFVHRNIIVPDTVVESVQGKLYVNAQELSFAVDAFVAYGIESVDDVDDEITKTIPDASIRGIIFRSEILRARITYHLITLKRAEGGVLAVSIGEAEEIKDMRTEHSVGNTSVMSADQLEALSTALEILYSGEGDYKLPEFNSAEQILAYEDNMDTLLASDIVRYRICEYLDGEGSAYGVTLQTESAFDLDLHKVVEGEVKTASATDILAAAQLIQSKS